MSDYVLSTEIVFATRRHAQLAYDVLRVDAEPPRGRVTKSMSLFDKKVRIDLTAAELRKLRTCIDAALDKVALVVETMEAFGPAVGAKYDHYDAASN